MVDRDRPVEREGVLVCTSARVVRERFGRKDLLGRFLQRIRARGSLEISVPGSTPVALVILTVKSGSPTISASSTLRWAGRAVGRVSPCAAGSERAIFLTVRGSMEPMSDSAESESVEMAFSIVPGGCQGRVVHVNSVNDECMSARERRRENRPPTWSELKRAEPSRPAARLRGSSPPGWDSIKSDRSHT